MSDVHDHREHEALVAAPGGSAERWGQHISRDHRVTAAIVMFIASYILVGAFTVGVGLLIVHVLVHGTIGLDERHIIHWFVRHRTSSWDRVSTKVTYLGDTITVIAAALIVTAVLAIRKCGRQSLLLIVGLLLEVAIFLTANNIVHRHRPFVLHVGGTPKTFSFPSGHSAASVVLYGGLAVLVCAVTSRRAVRFAAWFVATVLAVAVGLSRIYEGEHYPTDVLSGWIVGAVVLSLAVFLIRMASAHHPSSSPSAPRPNSLSKPSEMESPES
jgi:undecaprenyl-diphosphatase